MGLDLAAIDHRTVVKLPITDAGVEAAGLLISQGIAVTLTGYESAASWDRIVKRRGDNIE